MTDLAMFKEAMSRFPGGVVVATTRDAAGKAWGFTASSFSSLSMEPPLILVCPAKSAECYQAFISAQWFAISVLSVGDDVTAATFARRGADKFASAAFQADEHGSLLLPSAVATFTCQRFDVHDGGDHSILVGRVTATRLGSSRRPMVYMSRTFGRFTTDTRSALDQLDRREPSATYRVSSGGSSGAKVDSIRHCVRCGSSVATRVPAGDTISRHICQQCEHVHYINPTVVVGCIAETSEGRILMCRRQISPRRGYWTFPSGYLECGESADEGARREALEEAQAEVYTEGLLCVIDVPQVNEVHLIYRGRLRASALQATAETSEVALMAEADIPWNELAFTSVGESLRCYFDDRQHNRRLVHLLDLRAAPQDENCDEVDAGLPQASRL
jgi:flavin reductase (DIM6/NTAB) family NADH-FMN oxidoreductase RutF/ADP-ribose pyrophosphatase YjhB (NUDIX family)